MKAPIPRPTEINEPRLRCGMVRRKTVKEISREFEEYCLRAKHNLSSIEDFKLY